MAGIEAFNKYQKDLGAKIKELREAKKWDEEKLAKQAKVPLSFILQLEQGGLSPGDKLRTMIGDALDFDLNAYADKLVSSLGLNEGK